MKRTEMGLGRTTCPCTKCREPCTYMPSYLLPDDLWRLSKANDSIELREWAREHLLASPGAVVSKNGKEFRIRTLVPARKDDGSCHWLTDEGCSVHEDAPFGCAFFKMCDPPDCRAALARYGLVTVYEEWLRSEAEFSSDYVNVWQDLHARGLRAPDVKELRSRHG